MANRLGQLELPRTQQNAKAVKKQRVRKLRRQNKTNLEFAPVYNKYNGYS